MLDAQTVLDLFAPSDRRVTKRTIDKALTRNHDAAVTKLTKLVDGRRSIIANPPLITRVDEDREVAEQLPGMIESYRETLAADRQALFDHYRLVDMARKVVGVGSVGTRCYILLVPGPQRRAAVPPGQGGLSRRRASSRGLPGEPVHCGERVVVGQRLLQSASDVLLGWTTNEPSERHYYVRQLWDAKGSADVAGMTPAAAAAPMRAPAAGRSLARHARTADSVIIAGYLGAAHASTRRSPTSRRPTPSKRSSTTPLSDEPPIRAGSPSHPPADRHFEDTRREGLDRLDVRFDPERAVDLLDVQRGAVPAATIEEELGRSAHHVVCRPRSRGTRSARRLGCRRWFLRSPRSALSTSGSPMSSPSSNIASRTSKLVRSPAGSLEFVRRRDKFERGHGRDRDEVRIETSEQIGRNLSVQLVDVLSHNTRFHRFAVDTFQRPGAYPQDRAHSTQLLAARHEAS